LKKRTHARKSTFKKKNEDDYDDEEKEIDDHTFKSLAQILKLSKKTQRIDIYYTL